MNYIEQVKQEMSEYFEMMYEFRQNIELSKEQDELYQRMEQRLKKRLDSIARVYANDMKELKSKIDNMI
jgi:ABC-type Na+ transport system ATPase subunit NatA